MAYRAVTEDIEVTVEPSFLESESAPERDRFLWAYKVTIVNLGQETTQLINRYWRITDALGQIQEVRGPGVVGEQPTLAPGERFSYTSGAPLKTPSGIMEGHYEMRSESGRSYTIAVPAFSLDSPYQTRQLN